MQQTSLTRLKEALGRGNAMPTTSVIDQLAAMLEKSSQGTWQVAIANGVCKVLSVRQESGRETMSSPAMMASINDAEFVAAGHNYLPALIAATQALERVGDILASGDSSPDVDSALKVIHEGLLPLRVVEPVTDTIQLDAYPYDEVVGVTVGNEIAARSHALTVDVSTILCSAELVVGMAQSYIEDIETGLADGTYEQAENQDLPQKKQALQDIESVLSVIGLAPNTTIRTLPIAQLALRPVGGETADTRQSVLKGVVSIGHGYFHLEAIEVVEVGDGQFEATNGDYADQLDLLYQLSGSSLTAVTIDGRQYVMSMFPFAR